MKKLVILAFLLAGLGYTYDVAEETLDDAYSQQVLNQDPGSREIASEDDDSFFEEKESEEDYGRGPASDESRDPASESSTSGPAPEAWTWDE